MIVWKNKCTTKSLVVTYQGDTSAQQQVEIGLKKKGLFNHFLPKRNSLLALPEVKLQLRQAIVYICALVMTLRYNELFFNGICSLLKA